MASIQDIAVLDPKNPGNVIIPALGQSVQLSKTREGAFYDTVEQASGAVTANAELVLFRDFANKNQHHMNVSKNGKLPANNEMAMSRTGVYVLQAQGNTMATDDDIIKVTHDASLRFHINDRLVIDGQPLYTLPSGYGIAGMTTRNATGIVTVGIPSQTAVPTLFRAQPLFDKDDIKSFIDFKNNIWVTGGSAMPTLTNAVYFTHYLFGLIKTPVAN